MKAPNRATPWGMSDNAEEVAPGIVFYWTPSHGGFYLDPAQLAYVLPDGRAFAAKWSHGWGDAWFEEDCAWAFVAEAFPESFSEYDRGFAADLRADQRRRAA